jgi:glycolate oxidase
MKKNSNLTTDFINQFKTIIGENFVFCDEESLNNYGHDETENLLYLPEVILKPNSAEQLSEILKFVINITFQ